MIGCIFLGLALIIGTARAFPKIDADLKEWKDQIGNGALLAWNDSIVPTTYATYDISSNVDFYLYTQRTRDNPVKSRVNDRKPFGGHIDISKPMKLLIHGYMSHKDKGFSKNMREAYLNQGDFNVVNVDWSKGANSMYNTARDDVPDVGKMVAKFIDRLVGELRLKQGNLHVIGHSLGAHIAGVVGLNVKTGPLKRVTGLDPAGPLFSYNDKERLMPQSAAFVDVIHTCGKGLGFYGELGHVDFYPNQGTPGQPGCSLSFGKCSHQRAISFYIESISKPNGFLGKKCDDWDNYTKGKCDNNPSAFMGEHVSPYARGKFMLRTGESSPFGLGPNARGQRIAKQGKMKRIAKATLQSLQGGGLG